MLGSNNDGMVSEGFRRGRVLPRSARRWAVMLFLGVLLYGEVTHAGGYYLPGRGVRPLGRAGAVTADDSDLNCVWYNPANLAGLRGLQIMIDTAIVDFGADFTRTPREAENGDLITYETVSNESVPLVDPQLAVSWDFGLDFLTAALAIFGPYSYRDYYSEAGAQRYSIINNDGSLLAIIELGVGVEVLENLRLGAGLQNWIIQTSNVFMASTYNGIFGRPEDDDLDLLVKVETSSPINISGNFGVWWEIIEGLQLAAAFQLPLGVTDEEAKLSHRMPTHYAFDGAVIIGDKVHVEFDLPAIVRVGLRYVYEELFDVELDFTYEFWSAHNEIMTDPDEITVMGVLQVGELPVGKLTIPQNLEDTFSIRLGGDYHVIPDLLTVRAGYAFESGAAPDQTYSLFMPDSNKHLLSLGLSLEFSPVTIDLSYAHIFLEDRDIDSSELKQVNPTYEEGAVIIGNGAYQTWYNIFGLAVRMVF